jgi:serine/threonine-protein kinase HipA
MARDCGVQMSPSRLPEENTRAHFMTRRFERDGNQKHHVPPLSGRMTQTDPGRIRE